MYLYNIKSIRLWFTSILITFLFLGCDTTSGDSTDFKSTHESQVSSILFAHGFMSDASTWNHFSAITDAYDSREWVVYRTNVAKTGTIITRASQLADYINAQNLEDNSLLVVGHSMGGLDLRYIISQGNQNQSINNKYYRASKTIHQFYTIATPHKGSTIASFVSGDAGAIHDLSTTQMKEFNQEHPYSHSWVDGRAIPMLAFRFSCKKNNVDDGVVDVNKQILDGAPYTEEIFDGKHTSGLENLCTQDVTEELLQNRVIESILDNNTPKEVINGI